jgi:hypothetical protein
MQWAVLGPWLKSRLAKWGEGRRATTGLHRRRTPGRSGRGWTPVPAGRCGGGFQALGSSGKEHQTPPLGLPYTTQPTPHAIVAAPWGQCRRNTDFVPPVPDTDTGIPFCFPAPSTNTQSACIYSKLGQSASLGCHCHSLALYYLQRIYRAFK